MSEQVYKHIEVTGTSSQSIEDAIQGAVARAAKEVREMRWFEMVELRGAIKDAKVQQWQATVKIGYRLDDTSQ